VHRVRFGGGGALFVATCIVAFACANGASPTDLSSTDDGGLDDITRKEVTPVPPDPPPAPPPNGDSGGGDSPTGGDAGCAGKIVLNEVQTAGTGGASDEFIELFNPNSCAIPLANWNLYYHAAAGGAGNGTLIHAFAAGESITAGAYFLLTNTGYSGTAGQATYTNGLAGSPGGQLGLFDDSKKLVDAVGYGSATGPYVEKSAAPLPPSAQSIARTPNGTDADDNSTDFKIATTPTPGAAN
jgi:hypothetical protein